MKSLFILVDNIINIYIWVIIINVIISWLITFNVLNAQNRFVYLLMDSSYKLTSPLLERIRRFIPNLGSIDISPIVLILLLVFIRNILFEFFVPNIF